MSPICLTAYYYKSFNTFDNTFVFNIFFYQLLLWILFMGFMKKKKKKKDLLKEIRLYS